MNKLKGRQLILEAGHFFQHFSSIILFTAAAAALFIGVKAVPLDLAATVDNYFKTYDYFDLRWQTARAVTDGELQELAALPEVAEVQPGYTTEGYLPALQQTLTIESLASQQFELTYGRWPQHSQEILLDEACSEYFQLGDELQITGEAVTALKETSYTIVGFAANYRFLKQDLTQRKTPTPLLAAVLEECFSLEHYNYYGIRLSQKIRGENLYSQRYQERAGIALDQVEAVILQQHQDDQDRSLRELNRQAANLTAEEQRLQKSLTELQEESEQLQQSVVPQETTAAAERERRLSENRQTQAELQSQLKENEARQQAIVEEKAAVTENEYQLQRITEVADFATFKEQSAWLGRLGNSLPVGLLLLTLAFCSFLIVRLSCQAYWRQPTPEKLAAGVRKYHLYSLLAGLCGSIIGIVGSRLVEQQLLEFFIKDYIWQYQLIYQHKQLLLPLLFLVAAATLLLPVCYCRRIIVKRLTAAPAAKADELLVALLQLLWRRLPLRGKIMQRNFSRYRYRGLLLSLLAANYSGIFVAAVGSLLTLKNTQPLDRLTIGGLVVLLIGCYGLVCLWGSSYLVTLLLAERRTEMAILRAAGRPSLSLTCFLLQEYGLFYLLGSLLGIVMGLGSWWQLIRSLLPTIDLSGLAVSRVLLLSIVATVVPMVLLTTVVNWQIKRFAAAAYLKKRAEAEGTRFDFRRDAH